MTVKINFDALEPGTVLTNQLQGQGLIITTPATVTPDPETLSHVLRPDHTVADRHHPEHRPVRVVRGRFAGGHKHSRVGTAVSFCDATSDGVEATLRVFDVHGDVLDEMRLVSSTCEARGEISVSPSAGHDHHQHQHHHHHHHHDDHGYVASFEIVGPVDHFEFVTALEFDCLPDPDFRMVADLPAPAEPLLLRPGADQVVSARISFFRLHGSHGDVLLAVTRAPAGVAWSFDPPLVHSGVPHVDVELRATDEAQLVDNFALEIVGVPRSKEAGRHERSVTLPLTVLGGSS